MGKFLAGEKPKQAQFKASSPYFSDTARLEGFYNSIPRSFCLPIGSAEENLIPAIRGSALSHFAKSRTDRTKIYRPLFEKADCPINKDLLPLNKENLPNFDSLFYEPFYQFMRQQFLANEMEKAYEMCADVVSVLHIAPAQNNDFRKVTSPELAKLGESATSIWKKLVKTEGRFISVSTESLFGNLSETQLP